MTAFAALLADVRACTICAPHLPHGTRPVVQLDSRSRILLAGQAPGRKVHASGVPFADASGERLHGWLGMSRDTFYDATRVAILPMGFCYPGTGRSGDLPPRPECPATWREALLRRLRHVKLTLVIGRCALDYHPGNRTRTVTDHVRDGRRYWPDRVPLPHPSPRNELWLRHNPWFANELLPAPRERVAAVVAGHD